MDNELKEKMRVLGIRQPWASLIISGMKDIEVRTMPTKINEYVAIYATRTKPKKDDIAWLKEYGISDSYYYPEHLKELPLGKIIGTAYLFDCKKYEGQYGFTEDKDFHLNNPDWFNGKMYGWEIANPRAINPIEHKFKGSIVWGSIDRCIVESHINENWNELIQ